MLSTGDVRGCLRKLEALLRVIKYPGYVDYNGLSIGDPSAFLPIVSFALTSFSPPVAEELLATGHELAGKTDLRFTDSLYKVLRDVFHYKPILTKQQFLQVGFSQRKISVICDIINLVLQKHKQVKKPRVRCPAAHKDGRGEAHPALPDADNGGDSPFIVDHMDSPSTFPTKSHHAEASSSSSSPENGNTEPADREEDRDNNLHSLEVDGRLSALEARVESLLSGLERLSVLERRLEELDRQRHMDQSQDEGHVITVSRESWENLMSRVVLLETKLEWTNAKLPAPCPSSSSSCISDASKEDIRERLERITNMLTSTSSLLKSTESSTTPCK